jgi:RNA polymerase sigma factor (sigma-70 family)
MTETLSLDTRSAEDPGGDTRTGPGIVVDLFRKHATRVRRSLAFRLRNPDDAQDAAQEVFLKLWRQEREGRLRDEAVAYLNSAASSMATDFERWRTFHVTDRVENVELEEVPVTAASLEDRQHWRDAMTVLVEGVERLPELTRNVFLLHKVKGLTYPEVARQLGVSSRTVERHIVHALDSLEHRLRDYL